MLNSLPVNANAVNGGSPALHGEQGQEQGHGQRHHCRASFRRKAIRSGSVSANLHVAGVASFRRKTNCSVSMLRVVRGKASAARKVTCAASGARAFACAASTSRRWPNTGAAASMRLNGAASIRHYYWGIIGPKIRVPLHNWNDGIIYSIVQDPAINGLKQGGAKRDAIMGKVQRLGL